MPKLPRRERCIDRPTPMHQVAMSSSSTDLDLDLTYEGETQARQAHVATLLAFVCPGVAYMYVGRLRRGVLANVGFVLLVEVFVGLMSWLKFFPVLPLIVFAIGWLILCGLVALDVREIIAEEELAHEYLLKAYNHWLTYALMGLVTFAAPIAISLHLTERHFLTATPVRHAGMYPTLLRGDVVLLDRRGFPEGPERGDIVAVSADKPAAPIHLLRVVGLHGDIIRVEGGMLYINDEPVEHVPFELGEQGAEVARPDMLAMVEHNQKERYLIAMARGAVSRASTSPTRLGKQEMFLLSDNRSQAPLSERSPPIRDSRNFGAIGADKLRGEPLYILWSQDPESGEVRWGRIGLRVQP